MAVIIPSIPRDAERFLNYTRPFAVVGNRGVCGMVRSVFKADNDFWIYKVGVTKGRSKK